MLREQNLPLVLSCGQVWHNGPQARHEKPVGLLKPLVYKRWRTSNCTHQVGNIVAARIRAGGNKASAFVVRLVVQMTYIHLLVPDLSILVGLLVNVRNARG